MSTLFSQQNTEQRDVSKDIVYKNGTSESNVINSELCELSDKEILKIIDDSKSQNYKVVDQKDYDKDIAFKISIFKSNVINSEFSEDEILKIIEQIESKNFKVSDFYYTKTQNNRVSLLMKYTVMMEICLPKIEYITYEYADDDSYVDVLVKRKEFSNVFRWRVRKDEIQRKDHLQFFMLKKNALTQSLRIIFADIFGQLGFTVYGEDEYIYQRQEKQK